MTQSVRDVLAAAAPDFGFLGEEGGPTVGRDRLTPSLLGSRKTNVLSARNRRA